MQKKRIFAAFIALSMATLCACGNNDAKPQDDANTGDVPVSTDAQPQDEPAEDADAAIARGTWNGNVYTNESIGLTVTKPDDWAAASDEEMGTILDAGSELIDLDDETLDAAQAQAIYDMVISAPMSGDNVMIMMERNTYDLNEEQYAEAFTSQLQAMTTGELTYTFDESVQGNTQKIGAHDYYTIAAQSTYQNQTLSQYYYLRKQGGYMVGISCTLGEMSIDEMLPMFS